MTPTELREARQTLGLSQLQMANALGFNRAASVSDMERGAKAITPTVALLVAAYLSGWRPIDWNTTSR